MVKKDRGSGEGTARRGPSDGSRDHVEDRPYAELCKEHGVRIGFCDHHAQQFTLKKDLVPEAIVCGSQYDNAVMQHEAERVIVL